MNGASSAPRRDEVAHARAAISRIRLRAALGRRASLATALQLSALVIPALVATGLVFGLGFLDKSGGGPLGDAAQNDPLVVAIGLLFFFAFLLAFIAAAMLAGMGAFVGLGLALVALYAVITGPGVLLRSRDRRELERRLWTEGRVPVDWAARSKRRVASMRAYAELDDELVFDATEGLHPRPGGPPESCPQCAAPLSTPSPGVRHCDHCGFERYDELPARSPALEAARERVEAVQIGADFPRDRRALWRDFVARDGRLPDLWRALRLLLAIYFGAAIVSEVGHLLESRVVMVAPLVPIVLLALPIAWLSYRLSWAWYELRFRKFQPGVLAYDRVVFSEIVTVLAQQGRMKIDDLAEYLGVGRPHVEGVIASLDRIGDAPIYHDPAHDALVSLHAEPIDGERCPACGGQLDVAARGRIRCTSCGTVRLGRLHHAAATKA